MKSTESLKSKKRPVVLNPLSRLRKTKKKLKTKRLNRELPVLKTSQLPASASSGANRRKKSRWCHLGSLKSLEIKGPKSSPAYGSKEISIVLYKAVQTIRSYNY